MATDVTPKATTELSVGAGLAIAGIWLACTTMAALIMLTAFVWTDMVDVSETTDTEAAAKGLVIIIILIALPIITAYSITKKVLDKDT